MKRGHRKWLEGEVRAWADEGLITGKQADAILARNRKENARPSIVGFNLLAALGGLCVALGIVLVISHNWENIHRFWKLGVFLFVLLGTGEVLSALPERSRIGRAAVLILWILLPLGGIGLWGQVYQIHGDSFKPLLFWLILSAPIVWLTADRVAALLHTAGIIIAAWVGAVSSGTWLTLRISSVNWLMGRKVEQPDLTLPAVVSAYGLALLGVVLMWAWAFYQARKYLGKGSMRTALVAGLGFLLWLGMSRTVFETGGMAGAFLLGGALTTAFWGLRALIGLDELESDLTAILATGGVLYSMTFFWGWHSFFPLWGDVGILAQPYLFVIAVASACVLLLADFTGIAQSGWPDRCLRILVATPLLLGLAMFFFPPKAVALLANLSFALLGLWLINAGVVQNRSARINAGVVLTGFLVFTRFIDYFGTMLQSGMAYIATGVIFMLLAYSLNKGRQLLLARAQGGME